MVGRCSICSRYGRITRGWCGMHYARWLTRGTTNEPTERIRFLKVSKSSARWLAGVIDCEGWIGVRKCTRPHSTAYVPALGVGNTKPRLIKVLRSLTGVGVVSVKHRPKPWSTVWLWEVTRRDDLRSVLRSIKPYLLLKQAQAKIVLSLPGTFKHASCQRARAYRILRRLNKRGC